MKRVLLVGVAVALALAECVEHRPPPTRTATHEATLERLEASAKEPVTAENFCRIGFEALNFRSVLFGVIPAGL